MMKESEAVYVTGVDIGGSHITVGMVDMQNNLVEGEMLRQKVDSKGSANYILGTWIELIKELWKKRNIEKSSIGFAMPGEFDYENGICLIRGFDKYESMYGLNIREALSEKLEMDGKDILFRNDAEAFLAGELHGNHLTQNYRHVIGITLGTGLGSATSHFDNTYDAALSVTPYKGTIIEEYVSTRAIIRCYEALSGRSISNVKEVAKLLLEGDIDARKSFDEFTGHLVWFLEMFIEKEHPELLVVGGNIAKAWELFMPEVIERLGAKVKNMPVVEKAVLGENALLIGGANCFQKYSRKAEAHA